MVEKTIPEIATFQEQLKFKNWQNIKPISLKAVENWLGNENLKKQNPREKGSTKSESDF